MKKTPRIKWDDYFMGLAYYCSIRSHDSETKVGCVLVSNNRIISVGYNGFCSEVDEDPLPTTRPDKYPFMVHAEQNAITNMVIRPNSPVKAYITAFPCHVCAKLLWQIGAREWYIPEGAKVHSFDDNDNQVMDNLIKNGLIIKELKTELSLLKDVYNTLSGNKRVISQ
jgi:dCMP deaminase